MPYWGVYLDHIGFSAKEIGKLMAIFLATKMIAPNIWAWIADVLVARRGSAMGMVKLATLLTVLIYCLLYFADGFWPVAVIMLGYCVFWNATLPQLEAATLNHISDKKQYGRIRLWGSIGFIVTVSLLGLTMDYTGPAAILPFGAVALGLLFFSSLLMNSRSLQSQTNKSESTVKVSERSNGQALNSQSLNSQTSKEKDKPLKEVLNARVIILLVLCLLMQLSHAPLQSFMSLYLADYGYSSFQIGLLWSVGVICEIVVFIFAYKILGRYSLSALLTFTFLCAAVRWLLIGLFPDIAFVVVLTQASHSITFGLYHAVMMQLIDRFFVGTTQIRGQALYSSITYGLGGAIGSYLSGFIWSDIGKQELFLLSGMLMILVTTFSYFFTSHLIGKTSH